MQCSFTYERVSNNTYISSDNVIANWVDGTYRRVATMVAIERDAITRRQKTNGLIGASNKLKKNSKPDPVR